MLHIAMVHYHLKRGGVTRVIRHAARALPSDEFKVTIIAGKQGIGESEHPTVVLPELAYDHHLPAGQVGPAADKLLAAASDAQGRPPDIIHVHNHSLGKNTALPRLAHHFAQSGMPLLLQVHDFAEDSRIENYRILRQATSPDHGGEPAFFLYPQASHIHYAVLTPRDHAYLSRAGVAEDRLNLLPNCVQPAAAKRGIATAATKKRLFLYPTRAIRRKNLGEFLLWAALADDRDRDLFGVTLAPKNPAAQAGYRRWAGLARELGLPVQFAMGADPGTSYPALLQQAHAVVTTSIAEGFGLCFLEPWMAGKPLAGRDLPGITAQLKDAGLDLSGLYTRLDVPLDWLKRDRLVKTVETQLQALYRGFGRTMKPADLDRALSAMIQDGAVDFGRLDEHHQTTVLRILAKSPDARSAIRPAALIPANTPDPVIQKNREIVNARFGIKPYGRRLAGIYRTLAGATPGPVKDLDRAALLDGFLDPAQFFLLRTHL